MNRRAHLLAVVLLSALSAAPVVAQQEPAAFRTRAEQRASTIGTLRDAAAARLEALRQVLPEPGDRALAALDAVASRLATFEFASAAAAVATTEEALQATGAGIPAAAATAMDALREALAAGDLARNQQEWLLLLADRLESCQRAVADQADLVVVLRELDEALAQCKRWQALTRPELAALRAYEANHRETQAARRTTELRDQAKTELDQLEHDFKGLAENFAAAAGARDSAFSQFETFANSLGDAISQLPDGDPLRDELRKRLDALDAPARAAFTKAYGDGAFARIQPVFAYHEHEYAGWRDEVGGVSAEEYLRFDCAAAMLARPRTGSLVHRASLWLAFVATDPECLRAAAHPGIAELVGSVRRDREDALARLVVVAEALVTELERLGLADDIQRQRAGVLADNDLRVTLQEHAAQWPLLGRVHRLTDAYDHKTLGERAALAKVRDDARLVVELQWPRMYQAVTLASGFTPALAGKFVGQTVRLDLGRNCADEFAPGPHDLVFRSDGHLFAAALDSGMQQWIAATTARTRIPLGDEDEYEGLAVVGAPGTLTLRAADGKAAGLEVPCRNVRLVGVRTGLIVFLAR